MNRTYPRLGKSIVISSRSCLLTSRATIFRTYSTITPPSEIAPISSDQTLFHQKFLPLINDLSSAKHSHSNIFENLNIRLPKEALIEWSQLPELKDFAYPIDQSIINEGIDIIVHHASESLASKYSNALVLLQYEADRKGGERMLLEFAKTAAKAAQTHFVHITLPVFQRILQQLQLKGNETVRGNSVKDDSSSEWDYDQLLSNIIERSIFDSKDTLSFKIPRPSRKSKSNAISVCNVKLRPKLHESMQVDGVKTTVAFIQHQVEKILFSKAPSNSITTRYLMYFDGPTYFSQTNIVARIMDVIHQSSSNSMAAAIISEGQLLASSKSIDPAGDQQQIKETQQQDDITSFGWMKDHTLQVPRIRLSSPKSGRERQKLNQQLERDHDSQILFTNQLNLTSCFKNKKLTGFLYEDNRIHQLNPSNSILHQRELDQHEIQILKDHLLRKNPPTSQHLAEAIIEFTTNRNAQVQDKHRLHRRWESLFNNLTTYESRHLSSVIAPDSVSVSFQDIGALEGVKNLLSRVISLRFQKPELFSSSPLLQAAASNTLFFGPPGTGKTMLAKAVAKECGVSFISVGCAQIMDKFVGEGEKNVSGLFSLAKKIQPCIIFLDECDALLESRQDLSSKNGRMEVITQFMQEWDGMQSSEGVIVIGATNRPYALDDAILRRFQRKILIDLPDQSARQQILELNLRGTSIDPLVDLQLLAQKTINYSGSDLSNLCKTAADNMLVRFLAVSNNDNTNSNQTITMIDFEAALKQVRSSVGSDMKSLIELRKWSLRYGSADASSGSFFGFAS